MDSHHLPCFWVSKIEERLRTLVGGYGEIENEIDNLDNLEEERGGGGGGGGGGVYVESYTREARFLTRWDQHAVALRRP